MAHNQRKHCGPIQAAKRKAKYSAQFARTEQNRKRRRVKHLSLHPGDIQALSRFKELLPKE